MNSKLLISALFGMTTIALVQPAINAAELAGENVAAQRFLSTGVTKYNSGDKQGALADYNQAIQLNYNYALAYVNRGVVKSTLGDSPQERLRQRQGAIADFDRAISLDRNYAQAYNDRGAVKYELGNKRGAIDDYNRAISIDPKFAEAFYNRGATQSELGDKRGA